MQVESSTSMQYQGSNSLYAFYLRTVSRRIRCKPYPVSCYPGARVCAAADARTPVGSCCGACVYARLGGGPNHPVRLPTYAHFRLKDDHRRRSRDCVHARRVPAQHRHLHALYHAATMQLPCSYHAATRQLPGSYHSRECVHARSVPVQHRHLHALRHGCRVKGRSGRLWRTHARRRRPESAADAPGPCERR
jgi:hypothetical protein